jgi:hypothetical protein
MEENKMGLFDKIKDIFSEEVEDEPVKKEMVQVEIGAPKEDVAISENELLRKEEKIKTKIYFDDEDFDTLEKPKEQPRVYGFKEAKKEEPKIFRPSPIISPVYGVLDKNYHKEDIRNKPKTSETVLRNNVQTTIDEIRKKAFGTLEDDIENDLFQLPESQEIKKEAEEDLFDDLDFNLDGALDEPKHEKKEFELDYLVNINKSESLLDELKDESKDLEELTKLVDEDKLDKDDLFNLIDSMYDKEEN